MIQEPYRLFVNTTLRHALNLYRTRQQHDITQTNKKALNQAPTRLSPMESISSKSLTRNSLIRRIVKRCLLLTFLTWRCLRFVFSLIRNGSLSAPRTTARQTNNLSSRYACFPRAIFGMKCGAAAVAAVLGLLDAEVGEEATPAVLLSPTYDSAVIVVVDEPPSLLPPNTFLESIVGL